MASAGHVSASESEPQSASSAGSASDERAGTAELDRLERAVRGLIADREKLSAENEAMRVELETMRGLQERLLVEAQLRQDALKRIDDLVATIEELEPTLCGDEREHAREDSVDASLEASLEAKASR